MKIKITLLEELLGTASADREVHEKYIASLAPDAKSTEEEVAALGVEAVTTSGMTVFPRIDGRPFVWDYQIKGFFKDACGMLSRVKGTKKEGGTASANLKAYKKVIDGLIFVKPRKILIEMPTGALMGNCQRPLRAQTAQGERIALANSEAIPAGSQITFEVVTFDKAHESLVHEWLDYGMFRGLGQWRNSGKGAFEWEEV